MSRDRVRLRAVAIRRIMRRMRDDIRSNAGPIVLGVTFLAGLAWLLLGCGGATDRPGLAPSTAPSKAIEEPSGPIVVDADADAGADVGADVDAPCYPLSSTLYCPDDAGVTVAYWCHSAPGQMTSPRPGCWPLGFGDWDGGSVVAGQWCCQ